MNHVPIAFVLIKAKSILLVSGGGSINFMGNLGQAGVDVSKDSWLAKSIRARLTAFAFVIATMAWVPMVWSG